MRRRDWSGCFETSTLPAPTLFSALKPKCWPAGTTILKSLTVLNLKFHFSLLSRSIRARRINCTVVRQALGDPIHKKKWETILDLYSGIGTLALAVSDKADYVVGMRKSRRRLRTRNSNAKNNDRSNLDFISAEVSQGLLNLKNQGLVQIDAAILDPPRKGVSPEVLARVVAFHPERLVYVSCDPSTLARDLALLCQHGYIVEWAQPLDMFPQTYHVETVVRLTRDTPLSPDVSSVLSEVEAQAFRLPQTPLPGTTAYDLTIWKEIAVQSVTLIKKVLAALEA